MSKEILLHGEISTFSAKDVITRLDEVGDDDVDVRMNTNGGDPLAAWGIVAKMSEMKGKTTIKVDGKAISSGFFMLPFADKVIALNVSEFLVHRAAFDSFFEKERMTEAERSQLIKINEDLRAALGKKINESKFEKVTGKTFDEIFSMDSRIDVSLTAEQAKEIGLVDEIINLTDSEIAASGRILFPETDSNHAAHAEENKTPIEATKQVTIKSDMITKEKLKAEHPAVYASILADGQAEGVSAEKDRCGAWMAFSEIDAKAVQDGVESGNNISQTAMAQFMVKSTNMKEVTAMSASGASVVNTEELETKEATASTDAQKFEEGLNKEFE